MLTIRKMEPFEAALVKKVARGAFGGLEQFFVGSSKEAMVALIDGNIVGGIILKYIVCQDQKIGYFDTAFIAPAHQGKGIGGALYQKTAQYLWEQGCTALSALVKDDNVGSWQLFLNNGFSRVSMKEAFSQLGFGAMLLHYFAAPVFAANGMEFYLALKDGEAHPKKSGSVVEIFLYLLANAVLLLPMAVRSQTGFVSFLFSYLTLLSGGVLFGYFGSLLSGQKWRFRLNSCGAALVGLIHLLGGLYPMIGNWYPPKYENTAAFRRNAGITALFEWGFFLVLTAAAVFLKGYFGVFEPFVSLGAIFLIYRILAVYPFESYGGGRVYRWSRGIYLALAALSALVVAACWIF